MTSLRGFAPILALALATLASACVQTPGQGQPQAGQGGPRDLAQVEAQRSQQEVAAGEHIAISGTITGKDCTREVRLDMIGARDPNAKPQGEPEGPLTALKIDGPGEFSGVAPKVSSLTLVALCDKDGDGRIVAGEDLLGAQHDLDASQGDLSGIELVLEAYVARGPGGPGQAQ